MQRSAEIVAAARSWIGTAFKHQGRRKATPQDRGGVDCLGLLVGVAAACELTCDGMRLAEQDERDYGHFPPQERLRNMLARYLNPVNADEARAGDVVLLKVDGMAQHLGILGDYASGGLSLIHAYAPARAVVEHRLDNAWRGAVVGVFRFVES